MADGGVVIDGELMFKRLERFHENFLNHRESEWGGVDAICIPMGTSDAEQVSYSKSSAFHLSVLGYEFPDTIMILMKNKFYFMAHTKKCTYIETAAKSKPDSSIEIKTFVKGSQSFS